MAAGEAGVMRKYIEKIGELIMKSNYHISIRIHVFAIVFLCLASTSHAAPPTSENVDTYSGLCKIGEAVRYELEGKAFAPLALIARRILGGEVKLSTEAINSQFPKIKDEKNRLIALQSYQECMYRYIERFHTPNQSKVENTSSSSPVAPTIPAERRREIVYLANQLDDFKEKMKKVIVVLPEKYYDTRTSTEKKPRDDLRITNIDNYERYKTFQAATGILDFSGMTNNDISILCDTYKIEADGYYYFQREYGRAFNLQSYKIPKEVTRICKASKRGR